MEKSGLEIQVGYMKHWKPSIIGAVNSFIKKGMKKIVIVPLFFVPSLHVNEDIPTLLGLRGGKPRFGKEKLEQAKDVEILYAKYIGADERLVDIVLDRAKEALK